MSNNYIFVFDLDSTVTAEEVLPKVASVIGKEKEMFSITEQTMIGAIPFKESFLKRVKLLGNLPLTKITNIIKDIKLNKKIIEFIQKNKERCYIVTGNLDIFVEPLMESIDMNGRYYSSKGFVDSNGEIQFISVVDKEKVAEQFVNEIVAIGDGSNDAEIIDLATIGIGFGGVRNIADSVLETCDFAFYDEDSLVSFLESLM